jgi:hypothetical protein
MWASVASLPNFAAAQDETATLVNSTKSWSLELPAKPIGPDHQTFALAIARLDWDDTPAIPFDEIFTITPGAISLLRSIFDLGPEQSIFQPRSLQSSLFSNDPAPT